MNSKFDQDMKRFVKMAKSILSTQQQPQKSAHQLHLEHQARADALLASWGITEPSESQKMLAWNMTR